MCFFKRTIKAIFSLLYRNHFAVHLCEAYLFHNILSTVWLQLKLLCFDLHSILADTYRWNICDMDNGEEKFTIKIVLQISTTV